MNAMKKLYVKWARIDVGIVVRVIVNPVPN